MPTIKELKVLLDKLGIKYTSKLKKQQLIDLFPKTTEKKTPIHKKVDLSKSKKVSKIPEITIRRKEDFKAQTPSKETQKKRDEAFLDLKTLASKGTPVKILNKKERALAKIKPLKQDFSKELNKFIADAGKTTPMKKATKQETQKKRDEAFLDLKTLATKRKKGSPAEDTRQKLMKELAEDQKRTSELIKTTELKTTEKKKRGRPKKVEMPPVEITPVQEREVSDEDYNKYIEILGSDDVLSFIPKDPIFSEDVKKMIDKGVVEPSRIPLPDEILRDVFDKYGIEKLDEMSRRFLSREGVALPEKSNEKNWLKRLNTPSV